MSHEVNVLFTEDQLQALVNQAIQQGHTLTSEQIYESIPEAEDNSELYLMVKNAIKGWEIQVAEDGNVDVPDDEMNEDDDLMVSSSLMMFTW